MTTAELKHNMAEHTFNPPYALFMGLTSAPLSGKFMGAGPEVIISTYMEIRLFFGTNVSVGFTIKCNYLSQ